MEAKKLGDVVAQIIISSEDPLCCLECVEARKFEDASR